MKKLTLTSLCLNALFIGAFIAMACMGPSPKEDSLLYEANGACWDDADETRELILEGPVVVSPSEADIFIWFRVEEVQKDLACHVIWEDQ